MGRPKKKLAADGEQANCRPTVAPAPQNTKAADVWRAAFNAVGDPIFILDPDCRVVEANAAALAFLGRSLDQVVGAGCCALVHRSHEPIQECPCRRAIKTLKHEELEFYDESADKWLHVSAEPILGSDGEVDKVI